MVVGIILAAIGAALLALGMSVQRYAFTKEPPVPFLGWQLPAFWVWLVGLLIYFAANGVYAVSLLFAPLSLLAGIFTTLLLWNLYIGKRVLNEELTPQKYWGAIVVMLGVILTVSATSAKVPTDFSIEEIEGLFLSVSGAVYVNLLVLVILICVVIIALFEKRYPLEKTVSEMLKEEPWVESGEKITSQRGTSGEKPVGNITAGQRTRTLKKPVRKSSTLLKIPVPGSTPRSGTLQFNFNNELIRSVTTSFDLKDTAPLARYISTFSSFYVKAEEVQKNQNVPSWLDKCMALIYPGSLGLDEGVAHLSMKAFMALFSQCGVTGTCGEPIIWLMVLLWLVTSLATLWWMRTVFKRYETTKALPIEYGAVMAVNAMSGLIFYKESKYMETWQITLMSVGVLIIVIGLMVGLRENKKQQTVEPSTGFQAKNNIPNLEPIQEKNEHLAYFPQPKQAVEVVYALSRTNTAGFSRPDRYDDELFNTSERQQSISVDRTRQSFIEITSEHGFDLPETRGTEVG